MNRQEILWHQKSRELWLTAGDRNSKFFHAAAVHNRRKIFIATLKNNDGDWIESRGRIGDFLINEFAKLFQKEFTSCIRCMSDFFQPSISGQS